MWHAHEMLFGFALAVIVGFLFTAGRNWTRPAHAHRRAAGRAGAAVGGGARAGAHALRLGGGGRQRGLPAGRGVALARPFVAARNRRNYFFVGLLLLLAAAALCVHLRSSACCALPRLGRPAAGAGRGALHHGGDGRPGGADVHQQRRARARGATRHAAAGEAGAGLGAGAAGGRLCCSCRPRCWPASPRSARVAHLARWLLWQPWTTLRAPIVWVLHAAYLWIPVHLALRAAAALGWIVVAGDACADGRRGRRPDHRHDDAHRARPHRAAAARRPCRRRVLRAGAGRRAGARGACRWSQPAWTIGAVLLLGGAVVRRLRPVRAALLAGADARRVWTANPADAWTTPH